MSLFQSCEGLSHIFLSNINVLELAKVDLMVDGRMTFPIPSYAIETDCLGLIQTYQLENAKVDGISIRNINYLSAALYWHSRKLAYCFHPSIEPFILDIDPCDYISVSELYKIPKNGIYCELRYKNYYGFLVGWDYSLDENDEQKDFLNICWLSKEGKGQVFSFKMPKKYEVISLNNFKSEPYYDEFEKFLGVLLYILNQQGESEKTLIDGNEYFRLGTELGKKIDESSKENNGRAGHWRKAHLHLYWRVINGMKVAVYKWLDPVWVSASAPTEQTKRN